MRKTLSLVCGVALGLGFAPAYAETLQVPEAPAARAMIPSRGMSMSQVEARFGVPGQKLPAVGQPPISRWLYPNFIVYYEGHLVIHAVATQSGMPPGR